MGEPEFCRPEGDRLEDLVVPTSYPSTRSLETHMTYIKQHVRLSWLYSVHLTDEVAETSLNISTLGTSPFDAVAWVAALTTAQATTLESSIQDVLHGTQMNWADYSTQVGMKAAPIAIDGKYAGEPRLFTDYGNSGSGLQVLPQSSVVLSLRSGLTFGEANYGRMYLPHTRMALGALTPYASTTITDAIAATAKVFLNNVNGVAAAVVPGSGVVIASKKGTGLNKAVARVAVGSVTDTQRRRRTRLQEIYSFQPL